MSMHILKVQNLTKRFGGITAVGNCSFEVAENSITALIGPNGAGKTTMFDLISGFMEQDHGEIFYKEVSLRGIPAFKRSRMGIARTFQAIRIFPELTALDNVMLALPSHADQLTSIFRNFTALKKPVKERAFALLEKINLHEKAHVKAGNLSYGQQKLLEIIRAVATGGELILLDEPAAGVNRTMLHHIVDLIKKLHREGKTIFIVEHDMAFVMSLSQQVIVMDYGKEIAAGTPQEIQKNPKVLEAYLGISN